MPRDQAELRVLVLLAFVQMASVLCARAADATPDEGAGSATAAVTVAFFVLMLAATGVVLVLIRMGHSRSLYRFAAYGGIFSVAWFLAALLSGREDVAWVLGIAAALAYRFANGAKARLAASIFIAVGAATLLGIIFSPGPLIGLLLLLSAYDVIAVRKTRHMVTLATDVMAKGGPQMVQLEHGGTTVSMGLADIIFPSALVVSAALFTSPLAAVLSAVGSHVGLALMFSRMSGEGMPALPYGSVGIVGYLAARLCCP